MKQKVNTCRHCKAIFQSIIPLAYCQNCRHIDNEQFTVIENYLIKHPLSCALDIFRDTNVPISEILRYIDEGKLVIVDNKISAKV